MLPIFDGGEWCPKKPRKCRDRMKEKPTFQNGKPKFVYKTSGKYKGLIQNDGRG